MKIPKTFKKLSEKERMKYALKKKQEYELKADIWTSICRKLAEDKDFTPMEMDEVDIQLEKEQ